MTRFARAKGSKASNERVPEEATSWSEMKEQLEQKNKEIEFNKKLNEVKQRRDATYKSFLQEKEAEELKKTKWAEFPGVSKAPNKSKVNNKKLKEKINLGIKNTPELSKREFPKEGDYNTDEIETDEIGSDNDEDDEEFIGLKAQLDKILDSSKNGETPTTQGQNIRKNIKATQKTETREENDDDDGSDAPPEETSSKVPIKEVQVKKPKQKKKLLKITINKDSEQKKILAEDDKNLEVEHDKELPEGQSEVVGKNIEKKNKKQKKGKKEKEQLKLQTQENGEKSTENSENSTVTTNKKRKAENDQNNEENNAEIGVSSKKKQKVLKKPEDLTEEDKAKIAKKRAKKLKQMERRKLKKLELKKEKEAQENNSESLESNPINKTNGTTTEKKNNKNATTNKKPFDRFNKNTKNQKSGKIRDKEEHPRKKPLLPTKMMINGKEVDVDYVDGFPVKKEDAMRLKQLRGEMISKGLPRSEINAALKLERRKAEKAFAREKKKVCFHCRKSGHNLSECPDLNKNQIAQTSGSGICFKCGSTEHTHFECKVVRGQDFKFASCFICNEQGHIARQCPDNARGLYPKGGACKVCGDVTHLKKDCPKYQAQQQRDGDNIHLETFGAGNPDDLTNSNGFNGSWSNKHKPNKIIKF